MNSSQSDMISIKKLTLSILLTSFLISGNFNQLIESTPFQVQTPILFIHGVGGNSYNWDRMINRFKDDGWDNSSLFAYTFHDPSNASAEANIANAYQINQWVSDILELTGANKVDIVAHSMGGLSSRYFLKFINSSDVIDDYVTIGSPHHGSPLSIEYGSLPFIISLNEGDETPRGVLNDTLGDRYDDIINVTYNGTHIPGSISYTTLYSKADTVVTPYNTSRLEGAVNIVLEGLSHIDLVLSPIGYYPVRAAVDDLNRSFTSTTTTISTTEHFSSNDSTPGLEISFLLLSLVVWLMYKKKG